MAEMRGSDRGVSEVFSYVFVFSLILFSVGVVSVAGFGALENVRTTEQAKNAENAFDVLHSNMAELYNGGAPSRATEIDLGDTELFYGEPITVNVTINSQTPVKYETRPIVQRLEGQRRLVYEGGTVFRTSRQSGIVIHDPPQLYQPDQVHITVPALQSETVESVGGSTILVRGKVTDREVMSSRSDDGSDEITINVTSPRYELWEKSLRNQHGLTCTTVDSENRVSCTRDNLDRAYITVYEIDISLVQ